MARKKINPDIYQIEATERAIEKENYLSHYDQLKSHTERLRKTIRRLFFQSELSDESQKILESQIEELEETALDWAISVELSKRENGEIPIVLDSEIVDPEKWFSDWQGLDPEKLKSEYEKTDPEPVFNSAEYLETVKKIISGAFRSQKAIKLFAVAEYIYLRCRMYGRALIGYQQIKKQFGIGIGERQSKEYLRDLQKLKIIRKTKKHSIGKRPSEFEWVDQLNLNRLPKEDRPEQRYFSR